MQVNFNERSTEVINRLSPLDQVHIIGILGDLTEEQCQKYSGESGFRCVTHNGKAYYCVPIDDFCFYLEHNRERLLCFHVTPRHSVKDFCRPWDLLEELENGPIPQMECTQDEGQRK
jgi:hypothetical protein